MSGSCGEQESPDGESGLRYKCMGCDVGTLTFTRSLSQ
jgi:hypothetical protein